MPVIHIIAIGPSGSGKSVLVNHFSNNLPEGYKLESIKSIIPEVNGQEHWVLTIERIQQNDFR